MFVSFEVTLLLGIFSTCLLLPQVPVVHFNQFLVLPNIVIAFLHLFWFLQVLFLMYHYFAATEIYNAIRVFIAAYVWMTGFGNFSYYYIRKDFSLARFAQVILRLLFLYLNLHCTIVSLIKFVWNFHPELRDTNSA